MSNYGRILNKLQKQSFPVYYDGDLFCNKCGEPWNVRSLSEDMTEEELLKFQRGQGCPSCENKELFERSNEDFY